MMSRKEVEERVLPYLNEVQSILAEKNMSWLMMISGEDEDFYAFQPGSMHSTEFEAVKNKLLEVFHTSIRSLKDERP